MQGCEAWVGGAGSREDDAPPRAGPAGGDPVIGTPRSAARLEPLRHEHGDRFVPRGLDEVPGVRFVIVEPGALRTGLFEGSAVIVSAKLEEYAATVGATRLVLGPDAYDGIAARLDRLGQELETWAEGLPLTELDSPAADLRGRASPPARQPGSGRRHRGRRRWSQCRHAPW